MPYGNQARCWRKRRGIKENSKKGNEFSRGAREEPREEMPTLADMGLDKKTSSIAQKPAALAQGIAETAFKARQEGRGCVSEGWLMVLRQVASAPNIPLLK